MNPKNPLFKIGLNTFLQFWGKIISVGLSAFSIFLLTRYLGVEGYGNFSIVFAYLTFFVAFTDFGLQNTIVNKLSKKEFTQEKIFGTYLLLKVIIICFTLIASLIVLMFLPYSNLVKSAIIFSSVGVGIGALGGLGNTFFQYQIRIHLITFIDLVNKAITIVLILLFSFLKLNFFYILSSVLISNFLSIIFMFFILRKKISLQVEFSRELAVDMLKESAPIGVAGFLSITYFKLDTIMLSVLKNAKEVGIYSLSYKVFENILIIWTFYMSSFYPFLASFYHSQQSFKYKSLLRNSVVLAIILSLSILILGYLFAPLAIRIFGGENFSNSVIPLRILLLSSFFVFINAIFYSFLFIKGKTKIIIFSLVASLIFNFFINLLIIPKYGYIGASVTTVLTEIFLFLCYALSVFIINPGGKSLK